MLSLEKMARPLTFVRRSCSSRSVWIDEPGAQPPQRRRPAAALQDRPLGGDQLAALLAALEGILEGPDDADVRVAGALPAPPLAHLEEGVDPTLVGILRSGHGGQH
jgi:hypothetical protein